MTTVVFGASGNVGKYVAAELKSMDARVRPTSRDLAAAGFPPEADAVAADLDRPETLPAALDGAQRVFLYAKPAGIEGFVAAAEAAGVRHVVLLSSSAVLTEDPTSPIAWAHAFVESALERSDMEWTFLRPGVFAANALWLWRKSIRDRGVVRLPYPDSRTTPIHEKDLAALAVTALTQPGHHGRAYLVSGPESLTSADQVRHIGAAIGRDITVEEVGVDQARAELLETLPPAVVDGVLAGWKAGTVTPPPAPTSITEITGQPARTFAQWAADHADDFRGTTGNSGAQLLDRPDASEQPVE